MSTVAATVTTMTAVSERGIARRVAGRTECQSKVAAAPDAAGADDAERALSRAAPRSARTPPDGGAPRTA
ncbi:hypothetical protein AB0N07_51535, partial [Streptomyces sp. NPDC051172]|uniref:hypothetical protein n=1 Tax=Streptomyces sp. NPDC051172 TaxID=3155796 RepID=UPI00343E9EBC